MNVFSPLRLLVAASLLPLLMGCETLGFATRGPPAAEAASEMIVSDICATFPAITYSRSDTPETVAQIQAHNRAHDSLCGAP